MKGGFSSAKLKTRVKAAPLGSGPMSESGAQARAGPGDVGLNQTFGMAGEGEDGLRDPVAAATGDRPAAVLQNPVLGPSCAAGETTANSHGEER